MPYKITVLIGCKCAPAVQANRPVMYYTDGEVIQKEIVIRV